MNHFILDEGGWCSENEWDEIFPRTGLSTNLVKTADVKVVLLFILMS